MFEITFKDGKQVQIDAFSASQASILASADRIRAGESKQGFEHLVEKIKKIRPANLPKS